MLELKGIQKAYPGPSAGSSTIAVREVNLSIREGEFFSLLGPSGCGKTTLLRMLAGFETPTSGEILQDGVRIDLLPPNQRQFNLVFQRYALFPHLNVRENVAFGLKMKRVPSVELRSRVDEALDLVKMQELGDRRIGTLSGGQQQRIALARALVNRPRVLLLDEPLSALDLKLRQQMQVELLALQRRLGTTFIFVTHDQEEALTLSDRVAVMNKGVIEQVGSAREIYEYPRTPFVAQFIGSVNSMQGKVLPAVLDAAAESILIEWAGKRPIVVKPSRDGARSLPEVLAGTPVRVLVRPEKMRVTRTAPSGSGASGPVVNSTEGVIREILYLGAFTQLFIQVGGPGSGVQLLVSQLNAAATARKTWNVGDRVHVAWNPEDCTVVGMEGELSRVDSATREPLSTESREAAASPLSKVPEAGPPNG